ncbi:MAG: hypothetical protein A2Y62_12255 [Candidatus Fischerbacteria bacterium RBG_13_37_8]|uniref:Response regulatory domain-containing protein n=1 Tax=Candidatus Fischerbacteria bacterium RBG_13_37_8 TaxID=1817863 RepID=A0A1F5VDX1_9BACT|nr:MAG: hypothetical protein A2Y62_12255 [Candidatus Fischerbacteria bacterium RBG_13_37_8]
MTSQIFICPNCQVKFKLRSTLVLNKSVKVACPKCKKILFLKPKTASHKGDSTHRMKNVSTEALNPKMYDSSIQNEIVEDFLRYYKTPEDAKNEPIAIIADEPRIFREYLQKWLESMGFRTHLANDGREALNLLHHMFPDVLLLNVYLPVIMGINICEKIKNHPLFKKITVVLIGALWRTDRFRREPGNLYGADGYIEEAISKKDLIEKLNVILPAGIRSKLYHESDAIKDSDIDYAKRLARIIFSDIEIYNVEKIKNARDKGLEISYLLKEDIEEGRNYYRSKVAPSVLSKYNFFEESLESFLKGK